MDNPSRSLLIIGASSACGQMLRGEGFQVEQADWLSTGFELLDKQRFDVVLLNLAMPGSSGLDTFRKVRGLAPGTPFVLLARPEDESVALEALRLGAQDYCLGARPDKTVLVGLIHKAIERNRALAISRQDQHLLELLMNKVPDAIYFKDTQSRFLRISRAHARRFNLAEPGQAVGKTDADFFTEKHAQQARADEVRVMQTGLPLVGIEEMETWPDGTISWVSTTKMPLRDPAGKVVGTFGISRDITARKEAELVLAERTRQLRRKNQQMEEELKMARELQLAMLPQKFPRLPANGTGNCEIEFFSLYFPSGLVSGDFFDVIEISETEVGLFICDVMGHDVRAALVTAMVRSLVEDFCQSVTDPGQLLAQINHGLAGVFKQTGATMYATALYLVVDLVRRELRYSSAAHPDALHLCRKHARVDPLGTGTERKGPALGLFEKAVFPTFRRPLTAGDLVMLYTDGLIEGEGAALEGFTNDRLTAAVRQRVQLPAEELVKQVVAEIREFTGGAGFGDDVSLLGMEVKKLS